MKRRLRIILVILCFLLLLPVNIDTDVSAAGGEASCAVRKDKGIYLRLNDFSITAARYKLLVLAKTEFQGEDVWVCIYSEQYNAKELEDRYQGKTGNVGEDGEEAEVPLAARTAVKLFGKEYGIWKECLGITESNQEIGDPSYEVTIEGNSRAEGENDFSQWYILMEQDQTILPLELAEELYDFNVRKSQSGTLELEDQNHVFSKEPVFFRTVSQAENGLILEKLEMEERESESESDETETIAGMSDSVENQEDESESTETEVSEIQTSDTGRSEIESSQTQSSEIEPEETESETMDSETNIPVMAGEDSSGFFNRGKIFIAMGTVILIVVCVLMGNFWRMKRKRGRDISFDSNENEDTIEPPVIMEKKAAIQGAAANNKGRVRGNNEDNLYFNGVYIHREKMDQGYLASEKFRTAVQLYAVCDGMGGADAGEEASYAAVKELSDKKQEYQKADSKGMIELLRVLSDKIYKEAMERGQKSGTTIALMQIKGAKVTFVNIGDSRIYRLRNGVLKQISLDHSKVQRMVSMGILTPEQAKKDPARHVITQYLGMSPEVKVSPYIISDEKLEQGDAYLLCSDGLTDMVEDSQIEEILKEKGKPQEAVTELVKAALRNGGRDNITAIVLRVEKIN